MIVVHEHLARPDGSVRLVLRVEGCCSPDEMLAGVGGRITTSGPDALVAWDWPPTMLPADHLRICTQTIEGAVTRWAATFLGEPIPIHLLP